MLFLQISRHSPESCPMHNEKVKKINDALMAKTDKIMKKYKVKMIGNWVAMPEHLQVLVFDAPNLEAVMKAGMEPELMAWLSYNTSELIPVMTLEEAMKLSK